MKILWVCSSPIGPMAKALDYTYQGSSGGWIVSEFDKLKNTDFEIVFLTLHGSVAKGKVLRKEYDGTQMYYIAPSRPAFGVEAPAWMTDSIARVIDETCPDIIQIWGTESVLSCAAASFPTDIPKLIFLQGIIGIYVRYKRICVYDKRSFSLKRRLRDRLKTHLYQKQAEEEKKALLNVRGVILDNDCSKGYCTSINPKLLTIYYPFLPREEYFWARWADTECEPHSLFTIAASNPMKGLYQLLEIVGRLSKRYPDIKLYVPGVFGTALTTGSGRITDPYEKYLARIIREYRIEKNVIFTGRLDADGMIGYMKKSAVFVNPSLTEVHALSLREAMAVGMPCISTVCGSVPEFVSHAENGLLFRFNEPEVCESYIVRLFENRDERLYLSQNAKQSFSPDDSCSLSAVYRAVIDPTGNY